MTVRKAAGTLSGNSERQIAVRFNEEDFSSVADLAFARGMSLNAFIVKATLAAAVVTAKPDSVPAQLEQLSALLDRLKATIAAGLQEAQK